MSLVSAMHEIFLDIGCGEQKQPGHLGMDKRAMPGVDIVHDLEVFPYPIEDEYCSGIVGSHIIEHIDPRKTIEFFNELWRILKSGHTLTLSAPYAGTARFWQDPTHCNGFTEKTFEYFDPRYLLFQIYKPRPWLLEPGFPIRDPLGDIAVVMKKLNPKGMGNG